jgi:rhodanese-related sulfurtransferase
VAALGIMLFLNIMKTLTMTELHSATRNLAEHELILDVRTPGEFAEGHVPGAKNIPVDTLLNHTGEITGFKTVYIYCRSGGRAVMAGQILGSIGVQDIRCVDSGGFPDWLRLGLPCEK